MSACSVSVGPAHFTQESVLTFAKNSQSFDGDLIQGLQLVVDVLQKESKFILQSALNENQALYATYLVVVRALSCVFCCIVVVRAMFSYALSSVSS